MGLARPRFDEEQWTPNPALPVCWYQIVLAASPILGGQPLTSLGVGAYAVKVPLNKPMTAGGGDIGRNRVFSSPVTPDRRFARCI
jgi:hypothetical protein